MHIFRPLQNYMQTVSLRSGIKCRRSCVHQIPSILYAFKPKIQTAKKVTKNNLTLCTSSDLDKTRAKIPKDLANNLEGVTLSFTRLDTICDGQSEGQTDAQGKQYVFRTWRGRHSYPACIVITWPCLCDNLSRF